MSCPHPEMQAAALAVCTSTQRLCVLNAIEHTFNHLARATAARVARADLLRRIKFCAVGGVVKLYTSGTDCDGQHFRRSRLVRAAIKDVDEATMHDLRWADGPVYHSIEQPSC